ncbi:MAG: hypothetical protein MUF64_27080 [Polyangiaceae bacterium]|nr:hypothetical protein [Polyangiaceae bacterium]
MGFPYNSKQPHIFKPDQLHAAVWPSLNPDAVRNNDYSYMTITGGARWRMRIFLAEGESTAGKLIPTGVMLGPEDISVGMRMRVSLSRSCSDFGPSAQIISNEDGELWSSGSISLKTPDDPRPAHAVFTGPGLWYINVEIPDDQCGPPGEGSCTWSAYFRTAYE